MVDWCNSVIYEKYVFEEDDAEHTFVGDCLRLSYPNEFFGKYKYTLVTEFSDEKFEFDTVDEVTELVGSGYEDLVNHRIFKNYEDAKYTLMALKRGTEYALKHALVCPIDFKNAINKIKVLPTY